MTPATVIGVLTILGYSLYDTVVVFDKVRENTRGLAGGSRMTYSEAANLAVNQTLVRSINTSIIALLPVAAILFVGVVLLGAGTAQGPVARAVRRHRRRHLLLDLHRDPAARQIKEREPAMKALAKRVAGRAGGSARPPARPAAQSAEAGAAQEPTAARRLEPDGDARRRGSRRRRRAGHRPRAARRGSHEPARNGSSGAATDPERKKRR